MSELQWNLLNTNAPAQVGASFNPLGQFQAGQDAGLNEQIKRAQLNKLQTENEYYPMKIYAQTMGKEAQNDKSAAMAEKLRMEKEIKAHELRRVSANTIANAPDDQIFNIASGLIDQNAPLMGAGPEQVAQAKSHIQNIFDTQGPAGLRAEAQKQEQDAKTKLAAQLGQGKLDQAATTDTWKQDQGQQRLNQGQAMVDQGWVGKGIAQQNANTAVRNANTNETRALADPDSDLTQNEIDVFGERFNLTGQMPQLGHGAAAAGTRKAILKSAAASALGLPKDLGGKTPMDAALDMVSKQTDTKAVQGSLNFLEKQIGAMGSFTRNLDLQVDKVSKLSEELKTFDSRLLNVPLRAVRGRLEGNALQAKYDMYLTEISGEIAKLATGSSASISELSVSAREKWEKIHDPNLSVADMMSLLKETKEAGRMRMQSVEEQLQTTRGRMVNRQPAPIQQAAPAPAPAPAGNQITVKNPQTGEDEVWDLTTQQRVK